MTKEPEIPIKKEFRSYFSDSGELKNRENNFRPMLVGNPRQFILHHGEYYCVRDGCSGCPYEGKCDNQDSKVPNLVVPSARRAIGFENRGFLVLDLKPGIQFRKPLTQEEVNSPNLVPMSLWNTEDDDLCLDERNLHFIRMDPKKVFRVMKGQFRFYGTSEDFIQSPYAEFFTIFDEYKFTHRIFAFDFSAIEPRFSAIALRNPNSAWVKLFMGEPKTIIRQVEFDQELVKNPAYLYFHEKEIYCLLLGELDKADFEIQCAKCDLNRSCKTLREIKKNIPGDFHAKNTEAFMPKEFNALIDRIKVPPVTIRKVEIK